MIAILESLERAEYILDQINNYKDIIDGCPCSHGLPEYIGICERDYRIKDYKDKALKMCVDCWKEAIEQNNKEVSDDK